VKTLLIILGLSVLHSCAGYRLGGHKPQKLAHVHKIYVPLAKNHTLFLRTEALATNLLVDGLTQDGTYQIGTARSADADLLMTVSQIDYSQTRSTRTDSLRSEELKMTVTLDWQLVDSKRPGTPLDSGRTTGHTRFFARDNLQTARRGALPDALQRATQKIVYRITDGF